MSNTAVSRDQRHTRAHPCRICGNHESMPRRRGVRCAGFLGADGQYEHCERPEYAGALPLDDRTAPPTYAHRMYGPCRCGAVHNLAPLVAAHPARVSRAPIPIETASRARSRRAALAPAPATAPATHAALAPAIDGATVRPLYPDTVPDADADGAPDAVTTPRRELVRGKTPRIYDYRGPDGALVFQVLRWPLIDRESGEIVDKTFTQRRPDPAHAGGWLPSLGDTARVLYRLPELLAAPADALVFISEGEKAADALAALGVVSTTASGGALNWRHTADTARDALAGRHVVILPDNDPVRPDKPYESEKGQRHAQQVAASLADVAASVRVLMLPGLPLKGDAVEWIDAGGTALALVQLAAAAPLWMPDTTRERPARERARGTSADDGGAGVEGVPDLVELFDGVWCDRERTRLYRLSKSRGEDAAPGVAPVRFAAGMPRLLAVSCVGEESDGVATEETMYRFEWAGLRERGTFNTTEKDLNSGEVWARCPGVAITSRRDRDFWADVLKAQVIAFAIPVGVSRLHTGWHRNEVSGTWECYLRDGRIVQRPDAPGVPVVGLRFDAQHQRAWDEQMRELPTATPSADELRALLDFAAQVDPCGRLLIQMGAALRASLAAFVPVATAILPTGQSRAGKTSSANFARGWDGPCPARAKADSVFTGTIPGLAASLGPLHDLYVLIDDFHIKATDGPNEVAKLGNQLDMLITGAADGNDMRPRALQSGKRRREMTVTATLALTGEGLPATTESRILRALVLPYQRGEMDTAALHVGWDAHQRIWWHAGHAVMRWIGAQVNADVPAFRQMIEAQEAAYKARILADLRAACPTMDIEALDTLASNYARPALALWMLACACGLAADAESGEPFPVAAVLPALMYYAQAQARAVEMGGPGQASRDWILTALRAVHSQGRGHGLHMDGRELAREDVPGSLSDFGYPRGFPSGEHLYNYDPDSGMLYYRPARLLAALADAAAHQRPQPVPWPWTRQTLPGYLVKLGIVTPDADGRATHRPYVNGQQVRRLAVRAALIIGEDEHDDDTPPSHHAIGDAKMSGLSGLSGLVDFPAQDTPSTAHKTAQDRIQSMSGLSGLDSPLAYDALPSSATGESASGSESASDGNREPGADLLAGLPDPLPDLPRWQRAAARYHAQGRPPVMLRIPGTPAHQVHGRPLFQQLATCADSGEPARVAYAHGMAAWLAGAGPLPAPAGMASADGAGQDGPADWAAGDVPADADRAGTSQQYDAPGADGAGQDGAGHERVRDNG